MSSIHKCKVCGVEFLFSRSDTVYCKECRVKVRKEYLKEYDHKVKVKPCPKCGKTIGKRSSLCRECSNKLQPWRRVGAENNMWKGGVTYANGYKYIRTKHISGGAGDAYTAEHILVWEEYNNKKLPKGWVIHHLNGIKDDNRIENLSARSRKEHSPRSIVEPYKARIKELEEQLELKNGEKSDKGQRRCQPSSESKIRYVIGTKTLDKEGEK